MQKVKLYALGGGFVVSGEIPPFLAGMEARVLVWGDRTFILRRDAATDEPVRSHDGALSYDEAFAVALAVTDGLHQ